MLILATLRNMSCYIFFFIQGYFGKVSEYEQNIHHKGHRTRAKLKKTLNWKHQKDAVKGNGDYDGCFKNGSYYNKGLFLITIGNVEVAQLRFLANSLSRLGSFAIFLSSGPSCLAQGNQITVVAFQPVQLAQVSLLQKNQTLQIIFLISATLRWHRASVACKNQSL